jgi:hypothetical protein
MQLRVLSRRCAGAKGIEQVALSGRGYPASAKRQADRPRRHSQGMWKQRELPGGELLLHLVGGQKHDAIAREQHGPGGYQ